VGRDITDRKNAEVSLRQSEERFRTFMDNIPHIAFIKDQNGRYAYINRALEKLANKFSIDILLKTDYDWLPREVADSFKSIDIEVLASGQPTENLEIFKKDDTIIHFLTNKFLLKNAKGEKFVGGVSIDITERVIAEETIRENEARFRAVFETAGIGIVLASPSGYILKTNPAFENITGYTGEELSLMHIGDFTHPDDLEQSINLFKRLIEKTDNYYSFEKRYIRKDGEIIWGRVAASMVRTKGGTPMYVVATVEDITTQRTYTDHLKNLTEELRFKNQELELAKENAESANKAKSIFLSSMSHELRTPLNAILGFAQILKKDEGIAPRQRGFIETMYKSGNHLLDMINDVLDISKIESGKMELFQDDFDLYAILNDTHDMFNHPALQKGIRFNVSYSTGVPHIIYGDAKRLRQILINLLSNAMKFTQSGRISLHVTAQRNTGNMALCKFTVTDTGRGIPEDQLDVIFQPFRQIAGTYSEGSGLGLAISRRIAHLMEGTISVTSTVDKGSRFVLTLPLKILEKQAIVADTAQISNHNIAFTKALSGITTAGEKHHLQAISNAILNLPEEFSEALADAVEVQDINAIEFVLHKALSNYTSADNVLLKQLETAARTSDFRTLTHIGEILFKARSNRA
jgi:PAS domain S-box-containing protein